MMSEIFDFEKLNISPKNGAVRSYLCFHRKINLGIVRNLTGNLCLFQEIVEYEDKKTKKLRQLKNALFPIYNENYEIVGAEVSGTLFDSRYIELKPGSNAGYGYTISIGCPTEYVLFFDNAIELLSFMSVMKLKRKLMTGYKLVSLAGLKESIADRTIENVQAIPILCVNSYDQGKEFTERIKANYPQVKVRPPDSEFQTWNQQLCKMSEYKKYCDWPNWLFLFLALSAKLTQLTPSPLYMVWSPTVFYPPSCWAIQPDSNNQKE